MLQDLKYLWYRTKFRYGQHLPLRKPVDVSLELSSICNMKCSYCYHGDPTHLPFKKGLMSWDTAEKIIIQCAELGVPSLKMNWKGESTVNPIFGDVTRLAKNLAKGSTFMDRLSNSNFKFNHNREDIFEGLANQTKVKVSFDSFNPRVFETQRTGGIHSITQKNIDIFYNHKARKKSNTELVIQAVRTKLNKDEDIYGETKKRWPSALVSIRDMVGGRVEGDLSLLENVSRDNRERQSCLQAHVRLIFTNGGIAQPCCPAIRENLAIGDINSNSVYDIFNSYEARTLRKNLKSGKAFLKDPCKTCSSFESFKGTKLPWNS